MEGADGKGFLKLAIPSLLSPPVRESNSPPGRLPMPETEEASRKQCVKWFQTSFLMTEGRAGCLVGSPNLQEKNKDSPTLSGLGDNLLRIRRKIS